MLDLYQKEKEKNEKLEKQIKLEIEGRDILATLCNAEKEKTEELRNQNAELRDELQEYKMLFDEANAREYRKRYIEERRQEEPNLYYPDFDEIYERYYQEKEKNKKLKKSLLYMVNQFAYDEKTKKEEDEPLYTGGLSALEEAFDVLNIKEETPRRKVWDMIQELLEEE